MTKIKCPKCGAKVEEIDCLEFDIYDDAIILKKWGECTGCKAEIGWDEVVPNNPTIERITVD